MEPMSPVLAGRLSTTEPPGKHEMLALAIIIQLNLEFLTNVTTKR